MKKNNPSIYESRILYTCLNHLRANNIFCWRQNSGALISPDMARFIRMQDIKGVADIIGLLPDGRFLAVECKMRGGRQSESQKQFQKAVERNNGIYIIARCIEDLDKVIK